MRNEEHNTLIFRRITLLKRSIFGINVVNLQPRLFTFQMKLLKVKEVRMKKIKKILQQSKFSKETSWSINICQKDFAAHSKLLLYAKNISLLTRNFFVFRSNILNASSLTPNFTKKLLSMCLSFFTAMF